MRLLNLILTGVLLISVCAAEETKKEEKLAATNSAADHTQIPLEKKKTAEEMDQLGDLILAGIEKQQEKKYWEAINFYTKALKIDEESAIAQIRRGICLMRVGRNKDAADDIWTGLHCKPKTVGDFAEIAWMRATSPLKRFRDGSLAVAYGSRALKENETAEYYDVLAAGYAEMGIFQKARETIEKGIKYFPDSPRIPEMKKRLDLYIEKKKYREDWGIQAEE